MKNAILFLVIFIFTAPAYSQSSMVFDAGTTIEVGAGADICADVITINGSYLGDGTKCDGPLPVELVSLRATLSFKRVTLNWQTATEVNNYGFEIDRIVVQTEGQTSVCRSCQWQKIAFMQGYGNSNSPKDYVFTDNNPPSGKIRYRLKQIDFDGSFSYSEEVEVNFDTPKEFVLEQNYPNPFNPTTTIEFTLPKDGHVSLKVFDMLGREVATLIDKVLRAGVIQQVVFDASSLTSGIYIYRLQSAGMVSSRKLMVMK